MVMLYLEGLVSFWLGANRLEVDRDERVLGPDVEVCLRGASSDCLSICLESFRGV